MKRSLAWILVLALVGAPALPALAADEPVATPVTTPVTTDSATPVPDEAKPKVEEAPALPEAKTGEAPAEAPEAATTTAEPELPKVVTPEKPKPEAPESPYKLKNFGLGFLGGAVLGAATGVLLFSQNDKGALDPEKAKTMAAVCGGIGGLSFGLAAFLLGTTTPEEVKPPQVEEGSVTAPGQFQASLGIHYNWAF
jgi:hypothetical protein